MTVLSPSLPPVSWITTRMVSFAPRLSLGAVAAAVRVKNDGTVRPRLTRLPLASADCKNARRVGFMVGSFSIELECRQGQHQVAQRPYPVIGGVLARPVDRHGLPVRLGLVIEQPGPRLGRDVALQEQAQEEIDLRDV